MIFPILNQTLVWPDFESEQLVLVRSECKGLRSCPVFEDLIQTIILSVKGWNKISLLAI